MLTLTSKKYEVEEDVQVLDEQDKVIYSFKMQITPEELKKIKELIFDKETMKIVKSDVENKEEKLIARGMKTQEAFEQICFKEHREIFRDKVGEAKYLDMVETIFDFFMNTFIEKHVKRINTMNTNLKKIG